MPAVTDKQERHVSPTLYLVGGSSGTQENRYDTTSDIAMGDGERTAVPSIDVNSGGTSR